MAAIYLVGGPSGAGKDTLLEAAQKAFADQGNDTVVFVKRDITREPAKCGDLEIPKSTEEFDAIRAAGGYALSWEAHNTKYAIPKAVLEEHLKAKRRCVLNVSRTIIEECMKTYESDDVEVYFLNITASAEELTRRLLTRAREPPEEVAQRVARAKDLEPKGAFVMHVQNEASKEEGATMMLAALTGTLKYSLWLCPASDSTFNNNVSDITKQLSSDCGVKPFAPHVTLCPSFVTTQRAAVATAAAVAAEIGRPVKCESTGEFTTDSTKPFRALVFEVESSDALKAATASARKIVFKPDDVSGQDSYAPHCSLLYGSHSDAVLDEAKSKAAELIASTPDCNEFEASRVVLAMTTGSAWWCWQEVGSFDLVAPGA